jgi:superfamily I DNA/RNA helicase
LVRALKKLGPEHMNQVEVLMAITEWEEEALKKKKKKGSVVDRAECLRVFAYNGDTLAAAIAYAESLFKSSGPVSLLSGHKAKGLEWPVVFHLDPHRIPSPYAEGAEEMEQELNVRYVIETRAKESLFLVTMEGFNANV